MGNLLRPLESKVGLALLSAVVVATTGAILSITPAATQGWALVSNTLSQSAAAASTPNSPNSQGPDSHAPAGISAATATAQATSTPVRSKPSPPVGGQTIDLHGTIVSINASANTLAYHVLGASTITVHVDASTQYQGASHSLTGLRSGWRAEVSGVYEADGSFHASMINSDSGGGDT